MYTGIEMKSIARIAFIVIMVPVAILILAIGSLVEILVGKEPR